MTIDLEREINMVITEFTIAEFKKTKFTNYEYFCEYIAKNLRGNKLDMVVEYIQTIANGANEFFGFGDEMYVSVFSFFNNQKYKEHYELIKLIITVHGQYVKIN